MNLLDKVLKYKKMLPSFFGIPKDTSYLVYFLISILVLAYIIPTLVLLSPSGTDVYTHMYSTLRMTDSNSLFEFYEKSFKQEQLLYDYPFGLWFFGSIVMKVTGMGVEELSYILPLILLFISLFIYYVYARRLLHSANEAILALIFLLSIPLIAIGLLNYTTSRFVVVFLVAIIYLAIDKPRLSNILIAGILVFALGFTHTGTYMFLVFFSISYFILSALLWKKFDTGMYALIVSLLILYVAAVQLFPFVQPQYIDKGRMVLTISESISSGLGLEPVSEMGKIFYERIFVANNLIYVIFWSSLIFAAGRFCLFIRSKIRPSNYTAPLAIPVISNIKNVSHGITTAPFWLGPVQIFLSIFGVFKLDQRGKCIALSLILTSFFPGALQPGDGTGSLREIYYLYLIIPISSAAGFYYIMQAISKYSNSRSSLKKTLIAILILVLLLPLLSAPIIGNMYYQPIISGTDNEREGLAWLGTVGNPAEGVPDFAYRERIDLYANKLTTNIPAGSETKRYIDDLNKTYFTEGAEEYTKDLYSFNIKYILASQRIFKGFEENRAPLSIDSNKQLDQIYSSNNLSIYKYITPPSSVNRLNSQRYGLEFEDNAPEIQDLGSVYLIENEFYKVKLSEASPDIKYIGTKTQNLLGDGVFNDDIKISWRGAYREKFVDYNLDNLDYPYVSIQNNEITYKTIIRDDTSTENWATLIVKYTFYEKTIQREITVANDWVNSKDELEMDLVLSSSIFAPVSDFEFNQIENTEETSRNKKIYPSQDAVILKDKKFNEIFFNVSDSGLFIKYSDLYPYPTRIAYKGSTIYQYGGISMDSSSSLSPGESAHLAQYISIGDKSTARDNAVHYTSILPYLYSEAKIPMIIAGYSGDGDNEGYSPGAYEKLKDSGVVYNEGVTSGGMTSLPNGVNPIGYTALYEKNLFKSQDYQNDELKNIKALGVSGVSFKSFKYNLGTVKALSDNNLLFAQSLVVTSPYFEFFREGMRHPKVAYYQGNETGVVLIPVTSPTSQLLQPDYDVESLFTQWKSTIDSVADDGGMAVFWWNAKDIGNPDYLGRIINLVNYAKSRGISFITPGSAATHFNLLNRIYTRATQGVDSVSLNITNYNKEEIKGVTYRLELPVLGNSCPYYAVNGRIPRQEIKAGSCWLYVSSDLKGGESKEITVGTNSTRKTFDVDFSNVYEGNSIIKITDNKGAPVANASLYMDARRFESDNKGVVSVPARRGEHSIRAEKPGFISRDYEITIKGRVYKLIDRLEKWRSNISWAGNKSGNKTESGVGNKTG